MNFRKSPIVKNFAGINFRESTFSIVKKGIYFREFGPNSRNSRNFLPTKISSLKVSYPLSNSPNQVVQNNDCGDHDICRIRAFVLGVTPLLDSE